MKAIHEFKVDIVVVLDYEMLYHKLKEMLKGAPITVIDLNKSSGVQAVKYDEKVMQDRYKEAFSSTSFNQS